MISASTLWYLHDLNRFFKKDRAPQSLTHAALQVDLFELHKRVTETLRMLLELGYGPQNCSYSINSWLNSLWIKTMNVLFLCKNSPKRQFATEHGNQQVKVEKNIIKKVKHIKTDFYNYINLVQHHWNTPVSYKRLCTFILFSHSMCTVLRCKLPHFCKMQSSSFPTKIYERVKWCYLQVK